MMESNPLVRYCQGCGRIMWVLPNPDNLQISTFACKNKACPIGSKFYAIP